MKGITDVTTCCACGRKLIREHVFENGRFVLKSVCCNPCCKTYNPYVLWKWR